MTPESLQYACDLLNRGNDRTDSAQMKCKVGKPCNGRCIPRDHECQSDGTGRRLMPGGEEHETYSETHGYQYESTPKGRQVLADLRKKNNRKTLKGVATLAGIGVTLGGLHLLSKHEKQVNREKEDLRKKREAESQEVSRKP